jgi:hypothetical protein
MDSSNIIKSHSILMKFTLGLLLALAFGLALSFGLDSAADEGISFNFGGDKSNAFIVLFFGVPSGSIIGFVIIDRIIGNNAKTSWAGIVLGLISCVLLGGIGSVTLLDSMGGEKAIFVIPIMMVLLALGGYEVPNIYRRIDDRYI